MCMSVVCGAGCGATEFRCTDGRCIGYELQCNGVEECSDGSDERDCGNYAIHTILHTCYTRIHTYIYIYTLAIAHAHTPIPHTLMDFETPCLSPLFFFQLGRMLKLKSNSRVLFFFSC